MPDPLIILVLGGGPDREREVSLISRAHVAEALRRAGHHPIERDITPDDTSALDTPAHLVFPVLHGPFGEGGPLQQLLEDRSLPFVGSDSHAAALAIDKLTAKRIAIQAGLKTPRAQPITPDDPFPFQPPFVLKPLDEGSSFGVTVCRDARHASEARHALHQSFRTILVERLIPGREITVGVLGHDPLPVIEIRPTSDFYDFHAKYDRDDTQYSFDIDLPPDSLARIQHDAVHIHRALGCRHLSRVDFLLDDHNTHWFIEINTMPGFTSHSLLPMAAKHAGLPLPDLCDRLVRLAMAQPAGR